MYQSLFNCSVLTHLKAHKLVNQFELGFDLHLHALGMCTTIILMLSC